MSAAAKRHFRRMLALRFIAALVFAAAAAAAIWVGWRGESVSLGALFFGAVFTAAAVLLIAVEQSLVQRGIREISAEAAAHRNGWRA